MSENRLENIKKELAEFEWFEYIVDEEDFKWLITEAGEAERLRAEAKERHLSNQALIKKFDEQDATITTLQSDNLLLAKKVSALRKLNIAYRLGDQKLADAALTELEALATPAQEDE